MSVLWNPSDKSASLTLSGGNLIVTHTGGATWGGVRADTSKAASKWYWEIKVDTDYPATGIRIGIGTSAVSLSSGVGDDANGYGYNGADGKKYHSSNAAYGASYTAGDIIGVALDLDAGKIWWSKNNVWQASGDPGAGTNEAYSGISGTFFPMQSTACNGDVLTARFNSVDQSYSPPSGFSSICPDIGLILTSPLSAAGALIAPNFQIEFACQAPFLALTEIVADEIRLGDIALSDPFEAVTSMEVTTHIEISPCIFESTCSGEASTQMGVSAGIFSANATLSCDHCFNYAQIENSCPTPTCKMAAVFRYARLQAEAPTPTASFRVGKRIEGECPAPEFTCTAYLGRNPSIIASSPVPTCSMRVGLSLSDEATLFRKTGVPVPTCSMIADTHHLATLYGNVPAPTCEIIADTENIAIISASVPCPRGLFTTTIGNVADIYGRVPCPACSMLALTGTVVKLEGRVPVPGPLVRFHASLLNVSITLEGNMPVPTMTSSVFCSMPSLVLRHERGEVR